MRPDRHKRIYPSDWPHLVAQVRKRSGNRCECTGECGLHKTNPGTRRCIERNGEKARWAKGKVMLTTAHLCHDSTCGRLDHLKHMCNRCHLRLDTPQHVANARKTRHGKKAIADLFD